MTKINNPDSQNIFDNNLLFDIEPFSKKLFEEKNILNFNNKNPNPNPKPKPFLKWIGGKRQLIAQFKELKIFPPKNFNASKNFYFEPFLGGGALYFDLLPKKAILSDINQELITTYNVIKNNVEELIKALKEHICEKEYFNSLRDQNPKNLSDINVASRMIFLNKTCFNGIYRVNKSGKFNVPFGRYSSPLICDSDNLRAVSLNLKNTEIKFTDYKKVLESAKRSDFIYFDPPYFPISKSSSFTAYTANNFLEKEQTELRDLYLELVKRGCYVMLSNSDCLFTNKLFENLEEYNIKIHKVRASRALNSKASGRGKINEILVTNY